ncbi:geranylgeranylglycerol-phosphate geranylgeranyltransferase [Halalkalicoccus jeotgali]|uniref:Digeranylgeranylglyceryl phosphate synthase n=1 Tax=Halalkalicoccus jeotgali (strain DSM 18796 / CECT 7217 / JCM 14584 / KCTC 4019 / B3) TaxID=795797 RepID=D8J5C7_HALJB|nr:geranylgeranylglycerol-phosphate geranylgeranyltransferase [Halalkalicoccus jeotgali]ADJ15623.1 prenyltransferase [Halalkalicoccus jeotgali B3]ELY36299.1 prenyltransferase [Halalkalicoccus jeotgali B3]
MAGRTARGLLELTRPVNALVAGVLTLIGAFVAGGLFEALVPAGAAAGATVFATGAGNAINDYFDREIDRINQPDRPIPRGAVSPRGTLLFSLALFAGAIVLALALPVLAIAIALINLLLLVAYTQLFKGLPGVGNAVVAALGGSTFLFGGAAVGNVTAPAVLFVLAALATFTREVIKDVEDLAGDREEGLNTLPIAIGARPALWVGVACLAVAVLASPLPYLLDALGVVYLLAVLPANAVMLWAAATSFRDPTAGQKRLKYGMFLAAAAFVLGRIAA